MPFNEQYFHDIAKAARTLADFLDENPEPGLGTWCLAAGNAIEAFYEFATHVPGDGEHEPDWAARTPFGRLTEMVALPWSKVKRSTWTCQHCGTVNEDLKDAQAAHFQECWKCSARKQLN